MRVQHPRAAAGGTPPAHVDVRGERVAVEDDGWFEVPEDATAWVQAFAEAYDVEPEDLRSDEVATSEAATPEPPFDPSELTVDELEERIADIDDVATLDAIGRAEDASKARTTAFDALNDRLDELEG